MFAVNVIILKTRLKHFLAVLTLFSSVSVLAQTYAVSGDIKDNQGFEIPYTNILLLKTQDSTVVTGTSSDDNGKFIMNDVETGSYTLKFSFIGFKDEFRNIEISTDVVLPTVVMNEAIETLDEIAIVVKKSTLQREVDRLVFNVANTSLSEGNMVEVLRNTPSVLVINNRLSVKNTSATVYINDRKVHLSDEELLELLEGTSASSIKSVEVITNPPAKYDAESGVVLNIVMAKNLITGYNGSAFSNYTQGVYPRMNYGISNFYKSSKLNIYANYSYNSKKINRMNEERVDYLMPNGNLDQRWLSDIDRNTWSETHNINSNIDYNFDDYNTLSLSTNMQFLPYFKYIIDNHTNITDSQNDQLFSFNSNNNAGDRKKNLGFDLIYAHNFKNDDSQLSVNTHYTIYDYRRKQHIMSDYFDSQNNFEESTAFRTRADQNTQIFTGQIDYELPIGELAMFEAGVKGSNIETESGIIQRDIVNGQEVLNNANSDSFEYNENIYAGYLNYTKDWEKWSLSLGLRAEHTSIEGISLSTSQNTTQDYLEWFPKASLSHEVSDNVSIYSSYNRTITRPNYNKLNPFKFFLNDNTIVSGNPNLQPTFIDHFVIGTSIGNGFVFEFYYQEKKDNILEIPIQDNQTNIITYSQVNLQNTQELGFDFLYYFNVTDNWFASVLTSFYNRKDRGVFQSTTVEQDKWTNYTQLTSSLSFLEDKSASVNLALVYTSPNLQGLQLVERGQLYSDVSISKTILKGKAVLSLAVSDIFNAQNFYIGTKFLDQDSSLFVNQDTRYVRLGFRYKFGNTKLTTNERELTVDERDRIGVRD